MRIFVIFSILLFKVSSTDLNGIETGIINKRIERQADDVWSWGYVDVTEPGVNIDRQREEEDNVDENNENPQNEKNPEENPQEQNPLEQNPQEQNPQQQNPQEQNPQEQNPQEHNPQEKDPQEQNPQDQNPQQQNPQEQNPEKQGLQAQGQDPCAPYVPRVPDFSGPGRRLSQVKCYEYIFDIKAREQMQKRDEACMDYTIKKAIEAGESPPVSAVGGRDTEPGEFPHMGALGWQATGGGWIFKCGASLISEKFVMSAGHCTSASPRDTSVTDVVPKIVRLGDKNIIDEYANDVFPTDANILKIISHPQYSPPKKYFDISLIELEEPIVFSSYIQPSCLWAGPNEALLGQKATLTGWGVVETAGRTTSPELQAAVVDVLDSDLCDDLLRPSCNRHWCGMQEDQLCAGKLAGGVDACQGDSGGPLQIKIPLPASSQAQMYHIIGVTSFGIGCARANLPGIYTRVSSFLDWIEDIVWK